MTSDTKVADTGIFLTGGTGFFGRALLRNWLEKAATTDAAVRVCVLTRNPNSFLRQHPEFANQRWLTLHQGNILSPSSLPKNTAFSHLLHAATDSTLGPQLTPLQRYTQIIDGTRNMLEFAVANQVPKFLLTSSGGVYGPQPPDMDAIPEHYNAMPDPLNPDNAYSVAKRVAEHLCALYQQRHGISTTIARCFAFVGRDLPLDVHFAIGNFIRDALYGNEIVVGGDGTPVRTYMDQRDLAQWLSVLLERGIGGNAYNVGSDAAITIRELAYLVRDTLAPRKAVRIVGDAPVSGVRNRYVPDIRKARSELGLDLTYSLQQSILNAVHHATRQC